MGRWQEESVRIPDAARTVAVPPDHVKWRVRPVSLEEVPSVLGRDGKGHRTILEPRDWMEEVTRLGQAVRADWAEVRQAEMACKDAG